MIRNWKATSLAIVLTAGIGAALGSVGALPAGAATVVSISNGVGVTPAAGWTASQTTTNTVTLEHTKPLGEFSLLAAGTVTDTVAQADKIHLAQYAQGFGLKSLKPGAPQQATVPGPTFDQVATIAFTAKRGGLKYTGLAAEYQNSKTGNGAFAVVISYPSSKAALKKGANSMFSSIISDT